MSITQDQALAALRTVQDPELFKDIVTLNMVKDVKVDAGVVTLTVELTTPNCPLKDKIEGDVTAALKRAGASDVKLTLTARDKPATAREMLPQIKHIIAVGAGKGGVGKSTVAVNLAVALQRMGFDVGLMDGDIYGPSMPTMLGLHGQTPAVLDTPQGKKIRPFLVHGVHAITIGSLVESDKPLIWRGPMATAAFRQLIHENTHWPPLDYLIVDLPPGTGDVPLTLCQLLQLTGAVVVATPQQVALDDAIRAVRMFQQLGTPVLGLIENMSYFVDDSGIEHDIFGRGGTGAAASRLGLPLLGELPMFTSLRVNSDAGTPHKNFESNAKLTHALETIAQNVAAEADKLAGTAAPTLEVL
ncbi:MAG: P-loop NTPase [Tepidisphaeraceae bacterium]